MRLLFIFLCLLSFNINCFPQNIGVKKFEPLELYKKEKIKQRNDNNGNPCALLIVQSLKEGLEFDGWIIGNIERKDDVYMVFMANGAKHILIKHADYQTEDVVFKDYGTNALKGGLTYFIHLADETKDFINKVYRLGWNMNDIEVPDDVISYFNMAAMRNDTRAQIAMALLSLKAKEDEKINIENSLYWINQLLVEGDSTCLESMPGKLMYAYANQLVGKAVVNKNTNNEKKSLYTDACCMYLKAFLGGYNECSRLFEYYPLGDGLPLYHDKIVQICKDSASSDVEKAMSCLGYVFERGICEPTNLKEAAKWFRKAYDNNPSDITKTNLCRVYGNKDFPIDNESIDFIKKQSEDGLPEALFQMGRMYEEGYIYSQDTEKAIELYNKTIELSSWEKPHSEAAYRLARIYYEQDKTREAEKMLKGIFSDDALFLKAEIRYMYDPEGAYLTFLDLSKRGYKRATEFIKTNY